MQDKDRLQQKLEQELNDYKSYVKEQGVDFAIDKAYELTVKQEIIDCLIYDNNFTKEQITALLKCDNILEQCYDEWLKSDGNLRETLNFVVDDRVELIIDDYQKKKIIYNLIILFQIKQKKFQLDI